LQGKKDHGGRNATLLVAGVALGILYNPVTGAETRKWLREMLAGDGGFGDNGYSANGDA
jgi:hypothetical protein